MVLYHLEGKKIYMKMYKKWFCMCKVLGSVVD